MTTLMQQMMKKNITRPDEIREFAHGRIEFVRFDEDQSLARIILEPGWRWSQDLKQLMGTESCQFPHMQYVLRGRLMIQMDDGSRMELQEGDAAIIPAGHDAWVVGDEPCVLIDFTGLKDYAKGSSSEGQGGCGWTPEKMESRDRLFDYY